MANKTQLFNGWHRTDPFPVEVIARSRVLSDGDVLNAESSDILKKVRSLRGISIDLLISELDHRADT